MKVYFKKNYLGVGSNSEIIKAVIITYNQYKNQTSELVENILDCDYNTQCNTLWEYFNENVIYQLDENNYQFFKTPARLLADGNGDCKSFSIFFASCLHSLNIPFVFRFVNFSGRFFTHVYVVANPDTENQIIFDAVETDSTGTPIYNYARPFSKKLDVIG